MTAIIRTPEQLGHACLLEREAKDLTQNTLAQSTQLRQATISSIEKGSPGIKVQTLFKLLAALDLELTIWHTKPLPVVTTHLAY
jgi:HTH-type transcriptional regulator/antitoxin HipB